MLKLKCSDQASPGSAASFDFLASVIRSDFRHGVQEEAVCDDVAVQEDFQKDEETSRAAPCDVAVRILGMWHLSSRPLSSSIFAIHLGTRPLITAMCGAQGSGKTTLLQHILQSDHGLRIAVIVNDIGAINVDASIIQSKHRITKSEEKVIALQNGCICCTLRQDLLSELVELSEKHAFDYVIIESSGSESGNWLVLADIMVGER